MIHILWCFCAHFTTNKRSNYTVVTRIGVCIERFSLNSYSGDSSRVFYSLSVSGTMITKTVGEGDFTHWEHTGLLIKIPGPLTTYLTEAPSVPPWTPPLAPPQTRLKTKCRHRLDEMHVWDPACPCHPVAVNVLRVGRKPLKGTRLGVGSRDRIDQVPLCIFHLIWSSIHYNRVMHLNWVVLI